MGQDRRIPYVRVRSAYPPRATGVRTCRFWRFVPITEIEYFPAKTAARWLKQRVFRLAVETNAKVRRASGATYPLPDPDADGAGATAQRLFPTIPQLSGQ